ncbi:hypothetical protein CFC21_074725 [Triticum aestivum]|uniref:Uncharacterized protein n=2 Tax=Triticum aestivum TaxID=4565 RepID=A0A9R1HNF9_WHEAT|nr:B3 domain-containing protein Os06g0194400-like [Triticum aestivum]KAF7069048.1 hypothetical protein CFC21_074725 [Triticum aestivum]
MAESNSYEEQRRRQVEENRRKLEELRLHHLSAAARPKPNPNPRPKRKAPGPGELRRSGRVAGLPEQPNYLKGSEQRGYRGVYEAYAVWKGPTDEERAAAVVAAAAKQKAEELQRRIHGILWPAFVKPVTHDCASRAAVMVLQPFLDRIGCILGGLYLILDRVRAVARGCRSERLDKTM